MLMEDHAAREKINRFDHERIPERVVHARGSGAFGTFKLHQSLEQYTNAKVLTDTSRTTPTFVRFCAGLGWRSPGSNTLSGKAELHQRFQSRGWSRLRPDASTF